MLEELRAEVCRLNCELSRQGLVTWTSGNVSGRDPATGLVVIKPSGVTFDQLTPENMVVVDDAGKVVEGSLKPSVDTPSHLYIYRQRPEVGGIVHTHSPYATAYAACGLEIPVYLTAHADEFGGPIPCSGYAQIGEEQVGEEVVRTLRRGPAVLLRNHGVFTIGVTAEKALKAAVMCEDVARIGWLARALGKPIEIPPEEVERGFRRYREKYGQGGG